MLKGLASRVLAAVGLRRPDPLVRFIRANVRSGQCALDVGANVGNISRVLLDRVGATGVVHAFEPNPTLVEESLSRIGAPNLHVHRCALSSTAGEATLYVDCREGMSAVASSLRVLEDLHAMGHARAVTVPVTTLDAFVAESGARPHFIKIDVEGHEIDVFRGAVETIDEHRPVLVFEFWETWWSRGVEKIFAALSPAYRLVRVQDGVDALAHYSRKSGTGVVDIACFPRPRSEARLLDRAKLE